MRHFLVTTKLKKLGCCREAEQHYLDIIYKFRYTKYTQKNAKLPLCINLHITGIRRILRIKVFLLF